MVIWHDVFVKVGDSTRHFVFEKTPVTVGTVSVWRLLSECFHYIPHTHQLHPLNLLNLLTGFDFNPSPPGHFRNGFCRLWAFQERFYYTKNSCTLTLSRDTAIFSKKVPFSFRQNSSRLPTLKFNWLYNYSLIIYLPSYYIVKEISIKKQKENI